MRRDEFDLVVDQAIASLPARFRARLENLVFLVEDEPPEPDLRGLSDGRPLTERFLDTASAGPDRITIYQGPHERMARSGRELRRIVRETVWHEVGHYFGLNEAEIAAVERRRERIRRLIRGH